MHKPKAVIYARGTDDEIARQQEQCRIMAEQEGVEVIALATDPPDGSRGWCGASIMLADGRVEKIFVASRGYIPKIVESVTQHLLPGRRARRINPPD